MVGVGRGGRGGGQFLPLSAILLLGRRLLANDPIIFLSGQKNGYKSLLFEAKTQRLHLFNALQRCMHHPHYQCSGP